MKKVKSLLLLTSFILITLFVLIIVSSGSALNKAEAVSDRELSGSSQSGEEVTSGIYRGVSTAMKFDVSAPLSELAAQAASQPVVATEIPERDTGLEGPLGPQDVDPIVQAAVGANLIPTPTVSFDGPSNLAGVAPPDPVGDVGPNHYVAMSNLFSAIYDKSGNELVAPFPNNTFWAGFGGDCETENDGDPVVMYDQLDDRWIAAQFTAASAPFLICVAVSQTPDPTGSYFQYAFSIGTNFPDYPKYGIWDDAFYMSTREFDGLSGPFVGVGAYAVNRSELIAGNPNPQVISFLVPPGGTPYNVGDGLLPTDLEGFTLPPAGAPNYFVGSMDDGGQYGAPQDALNIWEFHADFITPGNSTFTLEHVVPVSPFDSQFPCSPGSRDCIPQPNTSNKLDILSYRQRPMWRVAYRNFGSYETMVTNQAVEADTNLAGIRWYEIRDPDNSPFIYQEGTYAPGVSDGIHRWMGSIAMDQSGNMALGYSASDASSTFPSVWYTGRLATDPLGQMPQGEGSIIDGTGSQTGTQRWGDYSSMNVDPVDDCTFWYVNEYLPTTSSSGWQLRIGAFRFDQCGFPDFTIAAMPASQAICSPNDAIFDIDIGSRQDYMDQVDLSVSGNPAGTTAAFNPNNQAAPFTSTLTISNTGSAAFGSYSLDIVGIAPTSTHTTTVGLDVYTSVPGSPTLQSPADTATGVPRQPTFEWTAAAQGETYLLEVDDNSDFSSPVYTTTVAGTTHMAAVSLSSVTTYYWRVTATNTCGTGSTSGVFSFTTEEIPPILLVDDDDNAPDVRGVYIAALDSLGLEYDIWDTNNSDNEPDYGFLSAYDAVIWFTGHEFGGFAGPGGATEAALSSYLDGGSCLFISSQDYRYDRGQTAFMSDYLGVSTSSNDNGDYTSVTGSGSVFGSLGSYALSYNFTDFSDIISPDGTAELAFDGNNGNDAAVNKDSGVYRTAFFGFPWEVISTAPDREEVMETVLDWCGVLGPRGTMSGSVTDDGDSQPIVGAMISADDGIEVRNATTNGSGDYSMPLPPGTYDISVTATGYYSDTASGVVIITDTVTTEDFALTLVTGTMAGVVTDDSNSQPIDGASVMADAGNGIQSTTTNSSGAYTLTVPPGSYDVTVTASGYLDGSANNVAVVTNTVTTQDFALSPEVRTLERDQDLIEDSVIVGGSVTNTLIVSNTGNAAFDFTASAGAGWADVSPSGGTLDPGATMALSVVFDSNATAGVGTYSTTLTFSGDYDNSPAPVDLIFHVTENPQYDVYLPAVMSSSGAASAPTASLPWFVPLVGLTGIVGFGYKKRSWLSIFRDNSQS
ncbi:MAG: carboxypeptidase regulatory-like domain-containing protein [Candidatus Promineifilaceae bacterium]